MATQLQRCVPFMQVSDARCSSQFYCTVLGFQEEWLYQPDESAPTVAAVSRDGIRLFLTEHPESAIGMLIYFYVEDVDALYQHILSQQKDIEWPPENTSWNTREMQLRDLDGNKLRFGTIL